jgi:hypothetical protein
MTEYEEQYSRTSDIFNEYSELLQSVGFDYYESLVIANRIAQAQTEIDFLDGFDFNPDPQLVLSPNVPARIGGTQIGLTAESAIGIG